MHDLIAAAPKKPEGTWPRALLNVPVFADRYCAHARACLQNTLRDCATVRRVELFGCIPAVIESKAADDVFGDVHRLLGCEQVRGTRTDKSLQGGSLYSEPPMASRIFRRRAATAFGVYGAAVLGFLATVVAARELSKDDFARFALVRALKRTANWAHLAGETPLADQHKKEGGALDGLFWALADEYDLGAVDLLKKLAKHDDPVVRQKAVADLARGYRDRKP